jgi:hypothetical protein
MNSSILFFSVVQFSGREFSHFKVPKIRSLFRLTASERRWSSVWTTGGMTLQGGAEFLGENLSYCQFLNHKCHTDWPWIDHGTPHGQVGNWPPKPWHGFLKVVILLWCSPIVERTSFFLESPQDLPFDLLLSVLWRWRWISNTEGMVQTGDNRITCRETLSTKIPELEPVPPR